ncbi:MULTISPECIES: DUF1997 domain-containing protein [unclassified Synechocystis]|uniref:DUF1997 domain-containing protein n=1 Tax=unclassified Synechocystis TaxID=2640012 RepID=UPI0004129E6F|nr:MULTISPECIES: DUF1997 domain-containing protein [unclassified Synechocystis]AIE74317.1 hypothetical protein D082_17890 [Synechocystis sp. PCC 6714]MCT0254899.1 DUF1997 domain-containing protein [Synechocystis sp. CS-94]
MRVTFSATEQLSLQQSDPLPSLQHYLRQPQRLVRAIADPKLMEVLPGDRFRLKMRPLNFLDIYHFQPTVVLKLWSNPTGTVFLESESCEIRGIDYINHRFSLRLKGRLAPYHQGGHTLLQGKADLQVAVDLPQALWLTPKPLLEMAANGLLRGVLARIKQRLQGQLLADYEQWLAQQNENSPLQSSPAVEALEPI